MALVPVRQLPAVGAGDADLMARQRDAAARQADGAGLVLAGRGGDPAAHQPVPVDGLDPGTPSEGGKARPTEFSARP